MIEKQAIRTVPLKGLQVFEANPQIIKDLKNGTGPAAVNAPVLLRQETYDHSYPHCWRCRSKLIYVARDAWFVRTSAVKERMLQFNGF